MPCMRQAQQSRALMPIIASAAGAALASWAVKTLMNKMFETHKFKKIDKKLDNAISDTMDCSDPIAKY